MALMVTLLVGCGDGPIREVTQGVREFSDIRGRITARDALTLVHPLAQETSRQPVLVLITSGSDINAVGLSGSWEFVYHFPDRSAQAVYSIEPEDPETDDGRLLVKWRVSPRPDAQGTPAALPLDFIDSPEVACHLAGLGVDWIAGDPDLTLATARLASGEPVWAVESYGQRYTTPFVTSNR
jgi:hypothetical protein